jgi:hypothetical protein
MRARRSIVVGFVLGALVAIPLEAAADGGAYIQFDETHYLPGDTATGTGYVAIPKNHQDVLGQGPFFVYVVPPNAWIEEGKPLPNDVIRVGTAAIEREQGKAFEIRTTFTVPDVPGDYYTVQLCNAPCTIAGFREVLTGSLSIVQTGREAQLLNEQQELYGKYYGVRHKLRKATRAIEELETQLADARGSATELSLEVDRLRLAEAPSTPAIADPSARAASDDRPLVEAWALVTIAIALLVALVSVALAIVFSRRRVPRLVVPDTIAELDEATEVLVGR